VYRPGIWVQAWRPHLLKYINLLEKVQRRATKLIYSLRDKSYDERLKAFKLTTLEIRDGQEVIL
jgi:ribonuclease P/MRP protein subunit RPP40